MSWKQSFTNGISCFQQSKLEDALTHFDMAITLNGDQYVAYDSRAAVFEKLGRPKDALRDAKKVIDLMPDRWQGYARSARLFFKAHKHDAALTMVNLALERVKSNDAKRRTELTLLSQQILDARNVLAEQRRKLAAKTACHIGTLPVEILSEIFRLVSESDFTQALIVSHVCRHWREVTLLVPALWQTLVLSDKFSEKKMLGKGKQWIQRSRGRIRELVLRMGRDRQPAAIQALQGLVWNHLNILRIDGRYGFTLFSPILSKTAPHSLSNLEELEVTNTSGVFFEQHLPMPKLRSLSISGAHFSWTALAEQCTLLESLQVQTLHGHSEDDFFAVLQANPSLQTLVLDCKEDLSGALPEPKSPILLSALTHVELVGNIPAAEVMKHLHVPSLQSLHLVRLSSSASSVFEYLQTEGHDISLNTLRIHGCRMESSVMVDFLRRSPQLQILELSNVHGTANAVLETLAGPYLQASSSLMTEDTSRQEGSRTTAYMCPALADINFSRCPDVMTGALVRLVKTRNASLDGNEVEGTGRSLQPIASLVVDGCHQIEAEALPWLRSKVGTFSCVYMTKKEAKWKR